MTLLSNIFEWCLKHFYPRNSHKLNDNYYPSKEEIYSERLESIYMNGGWYLHDENTPEFLKVVERKIKPVYYLIESEGKYGFAFPTRGFVNNQKIEVDVTYDTDSVNHYTMSLFDSTSDYMYTIFNSEITYENINKITISYDTVITDHIKYTGLEQDIILDDMSKYCMVISREDFSNIKNNSNIIMQRLNPNIQGINFKKTLMDTEVYGIRLRNILTGTYDIEKQHFYEIEKQHFIITFNGNTLHHPIIESLSLNGFSARPTNGELIIELTSYEDYTGFKAKIIFDSLNGNSYTNASSITYI